MVLRKRTGTSSEKVSNYAVEKDPGGSTVERKITRRQYPYPHYPKTLIIFLLGCFFFALYVVIEAQNRPENCNIRRLGESEEDSKDQSDKSCFPAKVESWVVPFCFLGIIYMFMGLSFVCDEFFVPALEVISENWGLSNDVAGATLMAAGGSAPELFTSFIGTFQQSDVGFGTIVGSAVFNILFVIGVCALSVDEPLQLTWWPLARDCFYYTMSLIILSIFFAVVSDMMIEWWEALTLLALYVLYVIFMKYNMDVKGCIFGQDAHYSEFDALKDKKEVVVLRTGLLNLLLQRSAEIEREIATRLIVQVTGDMKETFILCDINGDGSIGIDEFKFMLKKLSIDCQQDEITKLYDEMRSNDEKISYESFKKWYLTCEQRIFSDMKELFNSLDEDGSGALSAVEIAKMLEAEEEQVIQQLQTDGKSDWNFEEFKNWYINTEFFANEMQTREVLAHVEEEDVGILDIPEGVCPKFMQLITLPLIASLYQSLPDVRKRDQGGRCYFIFIGSICWIGVYSYFMVMWCQNVGDTLGIPQVVMGLTFLAAGTSVPDLLSSVIVAKQGHGDMAVSSSVGSNIFDILVGLPLPWVVYAIYSGSPVLVFAQSLMLSLAILIGMLVVVVTSIHMSKWIMTKTLGYVMFAFYVAFIAQDLARAKWGC